MVVIVKMGRPQGKHPSVPAIASENMYLSQNATKLHGPHQNAKQVPVSVLPSEARERLDSFQESTNLEDINHGLGTTGDQHISNDGWSKHDEQPVDTVLISIEITGTSAAYANPSLAPSVVNTGSDLHIDSCLKIFQDLDERPHDKPQPIESIHVAERKVGVETSIEYVSHSKRIDAYQSEDLEYDHHEAEDGAEIVSNCRNLDTIKHT